MPDATQVVIQIASVSQRVVNALTKYAGRKTVESFQLDKIVVSSGAILATLNKALLLRDGTVDVRLTDWLAGEEPQICLDILNQMDALVNANLDYGIRNLFQASRSVSPKDKSGEAIRLFQQRKDCFHFLLTTDIWNREVGVKQVSDPNVLPKEAACDKRNIGKVTPRTQQVRPRKRAIEPKKLKSVLTWLNPWKCRDTHERTILLRQPDTCTWVPNTEAYKTWKSTEDSFLWLNGKAGAGKSVLAASVIDGLESTLEDGEILLFFYCDFRNERSTSASEVMRSLLSQLLQKLSQNVVDPGDLIDELIERRDEGASTVNSSIYLAQYVSQAAKQCSQQPFIVIDAVDECKDVEELLDALMKLNKGGIRLFVTSRPLQVIKDSFFGLPRVNMDTMIHEVSTDVQLHVTRVLDSHRRLRILDVDLKDEIYYALCEKADGMFRWVQCQLDALKQCVTAVRIRETLDDLPRDLNETYERILLGINEDEEGEVVRRVLEWLIAALEPLQLSQIMECLSVDLVNRELDFESRPVHGPALLDALSSLVIHDELTDVVVLSHFSVKEYLIGEAIRAKHPAYLIEEQAAHAQLAVLCMGYITAYIKYSQRPKEHEGLRIRHNSSPSHSAKYPRSSFPSTELHPLLEYVQLWGFGHLSYVHPESQVVLHAIQTFCSDIEQYPSDWEQLCDRTHSCTGSEWPTLKHDVALYILVAFAPEPLLRSYIGGSKLRLKDETNPLIYTVHFGKLDHARTLLSSGVSPALRGWSDHCFDQVLPLEVAVRLQNYPAVDLLLAEGSPVPDEIFALVLEDSRHRTIWTPSIMARLFQTDQFVEWAVGVQDQGLFQVLRTLDSPTRYSSWRDFSEYDISVIEHRLVQIGCDPYARFNETSLRQAVVAGHIPRVKALLALNIPVPADIILDASRSWSENPRMIRLFLRRGCDVHAVSSEGNTALHCVLDSVLPEDDCLNSVQILVDAGCDPSARNSMGFTPVWLASRVGYDSVIEYLLTQNASIPADILLTSSFPTASTIRLLLHEGADVYAIAANGDNPLHCLLDGFSTASDELLECAKTLIDAGCNPRLYNAFGETCLEVAAANGHLLVVEHLLSLNLQLSPNVLLFVSGNRQHHDEVTPMIRFLIDKGADTKSTRPNGDTPLHLCMNADSEVHCLRRVRMLVNAGCDPCACNVAGKTPFHIAAQKGYISVMEYLISIGIPVPSDIMLTVLELHDHPYFWRHDIATIRFLLERQVDTNIRTRNRDTLLHLAVMPLRERNALEVVQLLVHAGCDSSPQAMNSAYQTPLHLAAWNGHRSVIHYLLSLGIPLPPDILLVIPNRYSKTAEAIGLLVGKGANPSVATVEGDTPLHVLLSLGCTDENELDRLLGASILVHAGCDPRARNRTGRTPLHNAAAHGFTDILEYFLLQNVPLPSDIPLTSIRTVRFLLQKGVDVHNTAASYGINAAELVCPTETSAARGTDCLERAKFLVDLGLDLSSRNSAGETAIHALTKQGGIATLEYLLSRNIPVPSDVLLSAVPSGSRVTRLIRLLIREGASVNVATPNGDTPLHLILRYNIPEDLIDFEFNFAHQEFWKVVDVLLEAGAVASTRNADGETPVDFSEGKGRFFKENFLRLVRKYEANARIPSYNR